MVIGFVVHGSSCCFCLCVYSWECMQVQGMLPSPPTLPTHSMCATPKVCVCVQLGMYASPRYVTIPNPPPQPKGMCVCTVGNVCKSKVCYHPHPIHPPPPNERYVCVCDSWECMQVQGMLPSPTHPPTHPNPKVCVCVYSWECTQVQGMLPSPTHPPTHPNPKVCVCVQLGMYASPRYVTIPTPPTHPPQPKGMRVCVQMSPPKHVVCTDESDLCAQMRLLECVYR